MLDGLLASSDRNRELLGRKYDCVKASKTEGPNNSIREARADVIEE